MKKNTISFLIYHRYDSESLKMCSAIKMPEDKVSHSPLLKVQSNQAKSFTYGNTLNIDYQEMKT